MTHPSDTGVKQAGGWLPIATAPKDGRWIRVLCNNGKEDSMQWCDYTKRQYFTIPGEWNSKNGEGEPVLWQPIDETTVAAADTGKGVDTSREAVELLAAR